MGSCFSFPYIYIYIERQISNKTGITCHRERKLININQQIKTFKTNNHIVGLLQYENILLLSNKTFREQNIKNNAVLKIITSSKKNDKHPAKNVKQFDDKYSV